MLKQYFLDIMRKECNGLYLCEVPTGIGKSYQAAHAMEEYAKAMRQCARTITDERKLIYLTPLRKNVGEEEEELKKAYENEELFEKEVLHIKSNVDNIIENLGKVTIPQDKQPFNYDELKKQVKAYNGEFSPEIKKIWEDKVEEEERKFRKEIKNTLSVIPARERLERIKNDKQYQWIGQLYPVVFIKEKKIILMTISKFLSKNISLVDKSITFFDSDISKNAVIFMDEFDSTKEFVRNHIIQNSFKSNDDYLDVFRQIASNMDLTNFDRYVTEAETRIDEDGTKYKKFCDRAKKIMEDYKLYLNYKTVLEQDDLKQLFIFHDGQINTICKTNVCVYPRFDDIEAELLLLKADKELDKEQMIDALLHFKEDSPELVKKNKEDFEQVLNNLKNKEEEYVDKKFFYKKILKKGKLREGFNEYLRTEYRILLNLSKSKENLPLYDLDAMTDIHYSVSSDSDGELIKYFVGSAKALNRSVARSNPIRKIIGKTLKAEEILPMLTATFVRNEQYTVIPFPYKYIREYFQIS